MHACDLAHSMSGMLSGMLCRSGHFQDDFLTVGRLVTAILRLSSGDCSQVVLTRPVLRTTTVFGS